MTGSVRARAFFALIVVAALLAPALPVGAAAAPSGDITVATVPRPPFPPGDGRPPITRALFSSPNGSISCRRASSEMVWLECLLKKSHEIVRFGPDEFAVETPCKAPQQSETCRLAFGSVYLSPASASTTARFTGARRIPLERLVEFGRRTPPYPSCVADPNLGLMCTTGMDDQVGELVVLGLAGAIWSCPGYESVPGETPVPQGANLCKVMRP